MEKVARRLMKAPEPLTFHEIHGKGIEMRNAYRQATRTVSFGDAIVFSNRRVRSFERVFLRHRPKNGDWIGSLRVGFCAQDPAEKFTRETLPSLTLQNFREQDGYYFRACPDELLLTSAIIYIYYSHDGQIFLGGCNETVAEQSIITINENNAPYYLFCDIYGRTDQIEIVDERTLTNLAEGGLLWFCLNEMDVSNSVLKKMNRYPKILELQYFKNLFPLGTEHRLKFLNTTNQNIVTIQNHRIVCVKNLKIRASYAFINTAISLGEVLVCKIMSCEMNTHSKLLFGLTTCNPESIKNNELPIETTDLLRYDSSSRWFVEPDLNLELSLYDELAFWFDNEGRVYCSLNQKAPVQLNLEIPIHDMTRSKYYPFFDFHGQITSILLYNYGKQNQLNFTLNPNGLEICTLCLENLANTRFLPCKCVICDTCAAIVKKPSSLLGCPFDKQFIVSTELLS